ncbi:hypothetical protein [Streptomyces sp. NPDC046925]|uniref:effector-associated constant component EACC1 n=1 Tax=Streptomyces sp. NPDC046925 TaxID=3155375 RepID=UPI0033D195C0
MGRMQVRLAFGDGDGDGDGDGGGGDRASSLYRWLIADGELRGRAEVSLAAAVPGRGHMGGAQDVIEVVLANTIALGNLLVAVAAWRGSRPRAPQVRVERDGVTVTVEDGSAETVERVLRALGAGDDHRDTE